MTYRELMIEGKDRLKQSGIEEADLEAKLILEYVCGTDRNYLLAHGDEELSIIESGHDKKEEYLELIEKRKKHIPLQHLTGKQCFMGLDFQVNDKVLIPRQDTEILVEEVLKELHDGMKILDLCTGSGCILISLLTYSNNCPGMGTDLSEEALSVAQGNAEDVLRGRYKVRKNLESDDGVLGISGEKEGFFPVDEPEVGFLKSDLFEKIHGKYDIIVSNPPYIRSSVISTLEPEVREHDPLLALDGGEDGLFFYRKIINEAPAHLNGGGKLYFEIGYDQAYEVGKMMEKADFREITVVKDYAGLDRVVYGTHL